MSADGISAEKRGLSARWLVLAGLVFCCVLVWLFGSDVVPFFYAQLVRTGHRDVRRWAMHRMSASRLAGTNRQCWGLLADSDEQHVLGALQIMKARVDKGLLELTGAQTEEVAGLLDRQPPLSEGAQLDLLRLLGSAGEVQVPSLGSLRGLPLPVARKLTRYLDHPNAELKEQAYSLLATCLLLPHDVELELYLVRSLEDGKTSYRKSVLSLVDGHLPSMGLSVDRSIVESLMRVAAEFTATGEYTTTGQLLGLLAEVGGNEILDFIAGFADHENPEVRAAAARALGPMGNLRHVSLLMGLLQDDEPEVRWWAAVALGQIGDSAALPLLVEMAEAAGDEETLALALSVTGHLGDPEGEDVLVGHLSSPSERVVRQAVYSLSLCGSTAATRSIAELLDDPREEVRDVAHLSLSLLCPDGPGYEADTAEWREWLSRQGREDGRSAFSIPREIKILQGFGTGHQRVSRMRPAGLMPELRRWMHGPDLFKRVLAAELLSAWGDRDAVEVLIGMLATGPVEADRRTWALRALRRATGRNFFGDVEKWQEWYDDGCPGYPVLPPPRRVCELLDPVSRAPSPSGHSDSEPRGGVRGAGSPGRGASHD